MFLGDHRTVLIAGGKFPGKNSHPRRDGRMWLAELNGDEYTIKLLKPHEKSPEHKYEMHEAIRD